MVIQLEEMVLMMVSLEVVVMVIDGFIGSNGGLSIMEILLEIRIKMVYGCREDSMLLTEGS